MGPEEASVVLVAMLERFGEIRSPGGYLPALIAKAENGKFSCSQIMVASLNREAT
jgi:replication initiation protein RepC